MTLEFVKAELWSGGAGVSVELSCDKANKGEIIQHKGKGKKGKSHNTKEKEIRQVTE